MQPVVVPANVQPPNDSNLGKRIKDLEEELQFFKEENKKFKKSLEVTKWLEEDDGEEEVISDVKSALARGDEATVLELLKDPNTKVNPRDVLMNILAEKLSSDRANAVFNVASVRQEDRDEVAASSVVYKQLKKAVLISKENNHCLDSAVTEMENRAFMLCTSKLNPKAVPLLQSFSNPLMKERSELLQTVLKRPIILQNRQYSS